MALPDPIRWGTPEAIATVLSTELNSLANAAMSSNSSTQDQDASEYTLADFELNVTFGTAPVAGQKCLLFIHTAPDGTNFGTSNIDISTAFAGMFILDDVTTAQRIPLRGVELPAIDFQVSLYNESGQAFPASGSTLKMRRYSTQVVD